MKTEAVSVSEKPPPADMLAVPKGYKKVAPAPPARAASNPEPQHAEPKP